jgi:hypothetical protein
VQLFLVPSFDVMFVQILLFLKTLLLENIIILDVYCGKPVER